MDKNQYCVTIKLYTWADNKEEAIVQVMSDLDYLCEIDSQINGYIHPQTDDVVLDEEA